MESSKSLSVIRLVNAHRFRMWSLTKSALTIACITKITLTIANMLTAESTPNKFWFIWVVTQHAWFRIFLAFYLSWVGSIA